MKICHVTDAHKRYDERIFLKECTTLSKIYDKVYLVVADLESDEIQGGVNIVSIGAIAKSRKERIFKIGKLVIEKALELDADIYHLHDPELLLYVSCLKKAGKKVIFDSHEDVAAQILDKNYLVFPKIAAKIYEKYQKYIIRKLDAVIVVTPHMINYFKSVNECVVMITNYPEIENVPYENKKKRQVCFAGAIYPQWCHEQIAKAVSDIKEMDYIIAGWGDEDYLYKIQQRYGECISYLGKISRQKVYDLYRSYIDGMALNYSTQVERGGGTLGNTKIFEIMMCGIPVICSNYPLWKDIVDKYQCGIYVDAQDAESIRNAICYLADHPEEAVIMGKNGRKAVLEEYNWEMQTGTLFKLYERLQ